MLGENAPPLVRESPPAIVPELLLSATNRSPRSAGVLAVSTVLEAVDAAEPQGPANEKGPCAGRSGDEVV